MICLALRATRRDSFVTSSDLGVGIAIGIGIEFRQVVPESDTDSDPDTYGNKVKSFFPDQIRLRRTSGGAETCDVLKANAANPGPVRSPKKRK